MNKLTINSYAKLNLYLQVLGKRKDNYHDIETLFERIDLFDKIQLVARRDNKIKIFCNHPLVPKNKNNLGFKAAKLLQEEFKLNCGVDIRITKRIPVGSGMGGGSSNAAAVLSGLNRLWALKLERSELVVYAKKIGADVPFFISDTSFALGRERGDKIEPAGSLKNLKFWHILVVPRIKVSTPLVYKKWDEFQLTIPKRNVKILSSALRKNDFSLISRSLFNGLEEVTTSLYPEISEIKGKLVQGGVKAILMSGSGPTVFGFVPAKKKALALAELLKMKRFWQVFIARTR